MPPSANVNELIGRIRDMKSQGLTNNQIIQALQRDGFKSSEIFDALSATTLNSNQQVQNMMAVNNSLPGSGSTPPPLYAAQAPPPAAGPSDEELIEAIIDEKWNDLMDDINKVIAWKERTEQRIAALDQQLKDLKERFEKLHEAVIGKIGEYDQHILQVGSEVKAMEKAFSKVLPLFVQNVAELSKVAAVFKSAAKRKK